MVLLFSPTNRKIDVTVCTLDCLLWTFAIAPTAIVVFRSKKSRQYTRWCGLHHPHRHGTRQQREEEECCWVAVCTAENGKKDDSTRDVALRSAGFASYRTPQGQRAASNDKSDKSDKSDNNSGWSHRIAAAAATATTAVGETRETRETTD